MKKTILLMVVLLSFSGCVYKDRIVYVKAPLYPFQLREAPEDRKFPVRDDYVEAYIAWKTAMYGTIDSLNFQISEYIRLNPKEDLK